jgi:S-adenosylmethionine/arginine decarboxylase-like enzyme
VSAGFSHAAAELSGLVSPLLADADSLSAIIVSAAGAAGMPALGPPLVREWPRGLALAMLCREGHIVVHALAGEGVCFVDVLIRAPADADRALEVIARRLTAA